MKELFKQFNIDLTDEMIAKFDKFFEMMIDYNKTTNLTAITDKKEVWIKHFLDSVISANDIPMNASLIDVGTGAGFPGIPLKIVRPDIKLTLVDSLNKRVIFLRQLCDELGIEAEIIHSRAEDLARTDKREAFDVCVSRAVSSLVTLCEYCLPFVKPNGVFIAYKGAGAMEEINSALYAMSVMGGYFAKEQYFSLPEDMGNRNILIIKKVDTTPTIYPRGQNLPKLKPLVK